MSKLIDRRDFLLSVAPLAVAPALILGSVSEMDAQIRNFALQTPSQNAQLTVGQTVQISLATIKTQYPKISRIDFKANGQAIGTTATRPYQINWQPTQTGNFTLTAEAVLVNGAVVTTPQVNVVASQLEVLYDTLGNAADGWGWSGQEGYITTVSNSSGLNYNLVTDYIGTLPTAKRLRGFEFAGAAINISTYEFIPWSRFLEHMWLGIWRTDITTFYQSPVAVSAGGGSLTTINLGTPTTGSYITPVGQVFDDPVYVFGWDNLDVLLPANVMIEMSLQFEETAALFDRGGIYSSSRPGPDMLVANSQTGNGIISKPMAARIKVSN
jgi:hypothetical protein